MPISNEFTSLTEELVINQIYFIRNQKVMLDRDLAKLYGVETKVLKQQVRRNIERFPEDFMFEMTEAELQNWRSQFVTSNSLKMGLRYVPMCFTEQGVAMLSSVLKSEQAIKVNIQIIRVFTKLRSLLFDNTEVRLEIEQIKKKWKTTEKISNWFFSTWMNFWKNRKPKKRERKSAIKSNRIPSDCFLP